MNFQASLIFTYIWLSTCGGEDLHGEQLYFQRAVHEYESFGSVTIFRHFVPETASHAVWTFNKSCNDFVKCADVDVEIVLSYGSLPVLNPYNASLPEDAYLHQEQQYKFQLVKGSSSLPAAISSPLPGEWYVVVYRLKPDKVKIEQKGLSPDCKYYIQSMLFYTTIDDIPVLSKISKNTYAMDEMNEYVFFRYQTTESTSKLTVIFLGCSVNNGTTSSKNCALNVTMSADVISLEDFRETKVCSNLTCIVEVRNPSRDAWYYLKVSKLDNKDLYSIMFNIQVETEECENNRFEIYENFDGLALQGPPGDNLMPDNNDRDPATTVIPHDLLFDMRQDRNAESCVPVTPLASIIKPGALSKSYIALGFNENETYPVEVEPILLAFNIDPYEDVGGVLSMEVSQVEGMKLMNPEVSLCLRMHSPPVENTILSCDSSEQHVASLADSDTVRWRLPFPQAGRWFLGLQVTCQDDNSSVVDCGVGAEITLKVRLRECIDNCGDNGKCQLHYQDGLQYFSCKCLYGYSGFSCSDDSEAWPRSYYLAQVLLLTLSNIVFLVAAILAVYRHFYAESVSYFATAFFSTTYHACDSTPRCILDYDTLQFCDFFSSFMSILLTLIAMSKLDPTLKSFLHILGAFTLAFSAQYDRFSLWAIGVPLAGGVAVLLVSWGLRMYRTKKIYPSKKRWIFYLVPGIFFSVIGLVLMGFFETEKNYLYVHSTWHLCMGISLILILPPRIRSDKPCEEMRELMDINDTSHYSGYLPQEDCHY